MTAPARPEPQRLQPGAAALLAACGLAALAAGCAGGLEVRHLATGRVDTQALELRGPDLGLLRQEALRRCPQGAEVLRQAARDTRPTSADDEGRISRWIQGAAAWVDPPQREAQLLVLCKASPQAAMLPPALAPGVAASAPGGQAQDADATAEAAVAKSLPLGPITPEW